METTATTRRQDGIALKQRSYADVVEYLDSHWSVARQD